MALGYISSRVFGEGLIIEKSIIHVRGDAEIVGGSGLFPLSPYPRTAPLFVCIRPIHPSFRQSQQTLCLEYALVPETTKGNRRISLKDPEREETSCTLSWI